MRAIVSDIHANLEALTAVLDDIARLPVDSIYCLGDTVGYGPNPRERLDIVSQFAVVLRGDIDDMVASAEFSDAFNRPPVSQRMLLWTRAEIMTPTPDPRDAARRAEMLSSLKPSHVIGPLRLVHGSCSNPLNGYLFPEDAYNSKKMGREFSLFKNICFDGHTHLPGVFARTDLPELFEFVSPRADEFAFTASGRQLICNVGSVGQPRDGDPRTVMSYSTKKASGSGECLMTLNQHAANFARIQNWATDNSDPIARQISRARRTGAR